MSFFSNNKESYLGVDIGTASIKVVEMRSNAGQPALTTYGYVDIVTDIIRSNTPQNQKKIVESLKKVIASAQVSTDKVIAALPTFSVFNSIITLPPMSKKDLASAIKWEAKKYVPMPLEEMILDWKIIDEKTPAKQKNRKLKNLKKQKQAFSYSDQKKAKPKMMMNYPTLK